MADAPQNRFERAENLLQGEASSLFKKLRLKTAELATTVSKLEDKIKELKEIEAKIKNKEAEQSKITTTSRRRLESLRNINSGAPRIPTSADFIKEDEKTKYSPERKIDEAIEDLNQTLKETTILKTLSKEVRGYKEQMVGLNNERRAIEEEKVGIEKDMAEINQGITKILGEIIKTLELRTEDDLAAIENILNMPTSNGEGEARALEKEISKPTDETPIDQEEVLSVEEMMANQEEASGADAPHQTIKTSGRPARKFVAKGPMDLFVAKGPMDFEKIDEKDFAKVAEDYNEIFTHGEKIATKQTKAPENKVEEVKEASSTTAQQANQTPNTPEPTQDIAQTETVPNPSENNTPPKYPIIETIDIPNEILNVTTLPMADTTGRIEPGVAEVIQNPEPSIAQNTPEQVGPSTNLERLKEIFNRDFFERNKRKIYATAGAILGILAGGILYKYYENKDSLGSDSPVAGALVSKAAESAKKREVPEAKTSVQATEAPTPEAKKMDESVAGVSKAETKATTQSGNSAPIVDRAPSPQPERGRFVVSRDSQTSTQEQAVPLTNIEMLKKNLESKKAELAEVNAQIARNEANFRPAFGDPSLAPNPAVSVPVGTARKVEITNEITILNAQIQNLEAKQRAEAAQKSQSKPPTEVQRGVNPSNQNATPPPPPTPSNNKGSNVKTSLGMDTPFPNVGVSTLEATASPTQEQIATLTKINMDEWIKNIGSDGLWGFGAKNGAEVFKNFKDLSASEIRTGEATELAKKFGLSASDIKNVQTLLYSKMFLNGVGTTDIKDGETVGSLLERCAEATARTNYKTAPTQNALLNQQTV